jgi:hypothetical protein
MEDKITDEDIAKLEAALEQRLRDHPPDEPDKIIWQRQTTFYELGNDEDGCSWYDCDEPHWGYERIRWQMGGRFVFEHLVRLADHRLSQVWTPMSAEDRERMVRDLISMKLWELWGKPEIEE